MKGLFLLRDPGVGWHFVREIVQHSKGLVGFPKSMIFWGSFARGIDLGLLQLGLKYRRFQNALLRECRLDL